MSGTGDLAVVVGGSQGIGLGIAVRLAQDGFSVLLVGRTEASLSKARMAVAAVSPRGAQCNYLVGDLHNDFIAQDILDLAAKQSKPVRVAVCNQGGPALGTPSDLSRDAWEDGARNYLLAPIAFCQKLIGHMREYGYGRVIVVTSSLGIAPSSRMAVSSVMRSGLHTWVRVSGRDCSGSGVTVNAIAPHAVLTERSRSLFREQAKRTGSRVEEIMSEAQKALPMGRWAHVSEVASLAGYLAGKESSYISGSVITVDGTAIASS